MQEQLEKFCKELNDICKKYKVNMAGAEFEMYNGEEQNTYEVCVNGAWDIKDNVAQLELRQIKNLSIHIMEILGDKSSLTNFEIGDLDDPPDEYGDDSEISYENQLIRLLETKDLRIDFINNSSDNTDFCRKFLYHVEKLP